MKKLESNPDIPAHGVRAFVLCGGLGSRLRSALDDRPKSMALIEGVPFLQLLIEKLRSEGVVDAVLGTGYMAEKIEHHFGSGSAFGIQIRYSREQEPLGTGGALKLAEPLISDPVVVLNGDSYVDWALAPMLDLFMAKDAAMVIMLQRVADVSRYGSVTLDRDGRVSQFVEKGSGTGLINAGVYLLGKQVVRDLPMGTAISLEREVFPNLLDGRVYGLVCTGLFIDIGIPQDLLRAQTLLVSQARAASRVPLVSGSPPIGGDPI